MVFVYLFGESTATIDYSVMVTLGYKRKMKSSLKRINLQKKDEDIVSTYFVSVIVEQSCNLLQFAFSIQD